MSQSSNHKINFTKMHGAGNDYVYVDCFAHSEPDNLPELSREMSDRHKGIGADGLILICPSEVADGKMRMFNADGSESEMCGNGLRCVAKYMFDHRLVKTDEISIETGAGILSVTVNHANGIANAVRVDMGKPVLKPDAIPTSLAANDAESGAAVNQILVVDGREFRVTTVSMGNPHCVIFVPAATDELVLRWGPKIELHDAFPNRVNVEFVEVISSTEAKQRTWERGSGETQACGTGASAVCVAGVLSGRLDRKTVVHLLGGDLQMHWDEQSNHVFKTGPAVEVFEGVWETSV